jgi:transposase
MLSLPVSVRIFVACEPTDLRRSFDRLAAMVSEVLGEDPFSGHVFCFFNRRRDRAKLLLWDRGGFWLFYKRLEAGTFAVPGQREITGRDLFLVLEGIEVVRERARHVRAAAGR